MYLIRKSIFVKKLVFRKNLSYKNFRKKNQKIFPQKNYGEILSEKNFRKGFHGKK